jgi:glycosyltransferase involved in cell wall biosynthesis
LQRTVIAEADCVWFVSEVERARLADQVPKARTSVIPNGAPDELWAVPSLDRRPDSEEVMFVGPGFYEANSSGLAWFMEEVWPSVKRRTLSGRLRIVGLGWEDFDRYGDATFVGWRDSLVGEYSRTRVVIAPLFAGGGTKLKVVEAMASGRPVVTTAVGAEGLPRSEGLRICSDRDEFAAAVGAFLTDEHAAAEAGAANQLAVEGLKWSSVWRRASADLDELVGAGSE